MNARFQLPWSALPVTNSQNNSTCARPICTVRLTNAAVVALLESSVNMEIRVVKVDLPQLCMTTMQVDHNQLACKKPGFVVLLNDN